MKIVYKDPNEKRAFKLHLPNACLKSRWLWRLLVKYDKSHSIDYQKAIVASRLIYRSLKQYIRHHGHFDVVHVDTAEGEEISIRI